MMMLMMMLYHRTRAGRGEREKNTAVVRVQ